MCRPEPKLASTMKPTISPPVLEGEIEYIIRSERCYGSEEHKKKKGKGKKEELVRNSEEGDKEADKG